MATSDYSPGAGDFEQRRAGHSLAACPMADSGSWALAEDIQALASPLCSSTPHPVGGEVTGQAPGSCPGPPPSQSCQDNVCTCHCGLCSRPCCGTGRELLPGGRHTRPSIWSSPPAKPLLPPTCPRTGSKLKTASKLILPHPGKWESSVQVEGRGANRVSQTGV
jgi:hypothetical protein